LRRAEALFVSFSSIDLATVLSTVVLGNLFASELSSVSSFDLFSVMTSS
jgi:hypothetical protein